MADKKTFFESINENSTFDEKFYKKVYGYYICDSEFLIQVARKLKQINCNDIITEYNEWLAKYIEKNNEAMKVVAEWYSKELASRSGRFTRINKQKAVGVDCNQKEKELLQQKKALLQMRLLQSTGN